MMVDKSSERVQAMFGEIANGYDRMNHLLSMNVDHYWRWRTVRRVPPRGTAPILDVCTGTGDLAIAYHRKGKGSVPIVGADFCGPMLAIAERKKQQRIGGDELTFIQADTLNLPLADNSFQIVSVAFGLRNVQDTDRGLAEMLRVCQPGGRIAVLEFSQPTRQPIKALYGWYFRNILPRIGWFLARSRHRAYDYLPESVGQFPCGAALAARMRGIGMVDVHFHSLTFGIATLYVGQKPMQSAKKTARFPITRDCQTP